MHIRYAKNSRPVKPWVRRWMIWAFAFVVMFIPRFIGSLITAPWHIAHDEWEDLRDEVLSFKVSNRETDG